MALSLFGDQPTIDIDLLLLGKTGTGKSATGNSILLRDIFQTSNNLGSETQEIKSEWSEYTDGENRKYDIKVTDGPGLEDTNLNELQDKRRAHKNIAKVLSECDMGVHAFAVVLSMRHRFTSQDRRSLQSLKEILGQDFLRKFGVVIVTGGDDLNVDAGKGKQTFQAWCSAQPDEFQTLRNECDNRCVLFDNRTQDEVKRKEQLDILLEVVRRIISRNNGERYTNETFKKLKTSHSKLMREWDLTKIKEEFRKQLSILGGKVRKIADKSDVTNVRGLLDTLLRQVEHEATITPKMKALKEGLLILKTLLEEAGSKIERDESAADVLKKAVIQCNKMIIEASPPAEPSWYGTACTII